MLYHYTKLNALTSILNTQQFRLTKITDFDDCDEFFYTLSLLCKELEIDFADCNKLVSEIEKINNLIFVGCFCSDGDSPHHWKEYGKFNIEFSKRVLMRMVHYQQRSYGWISAHSNYISCEYCSKSHRTKIKGAIRQWKNGNGYSIPVDALSHLATFFKKSEFCPEQETRLVLYLKNGAPIKKMKVDSTEKEFWLLPFRTNDRDQPIKSITIGPNCQPEDVASLRVFLLENNLGDVAIKYSKIPKEEFAKFLSADQHISCQNCELSLLAPHE